jgi:Tfp pilus assembly protein FimT
MTLPSDQQWHASSGVTLLETLVVLSILAFIVGAVAGLRRGPSPGLSLKRAAAERVETAAQQREAAIRSGLETKLLIEDSCDAGKTIRFRPDGTAQGPDICLALSGHSLRLVLDPLTGRLSPEQLP